MWRALRRAGIVNGVSWGPFAGDMFIVKVVVAVVAVMLAIAVASMAKVALNVCQTEPNNASHHLILLTNMMHT